MSAFSKNNVQYTAAKVFVAPFDPESTKALNIPARTITQENDNVDAVIAYLESNYTFERMAGFKNVQISDTFENEVIDEVDDCDIQEWQKKAEIISSFTGDWLTTLDLNVLEIILGYGFSSQTGASVTGETYTLTANSWAQETWYRLPYQHHDGNGNIIAPATLAVTANATPIVEGTDYVIVDNWYGEFGIVIQDTQATTQEIVVTYDHTTIDASFGGFEFGVIIQPYMILKIETCPDENGKVHYYYMTKVSLSGSLDTSFISTGEIPLSSITLAWGKGGNKYFKKEV